MLLIDKWFAGTKNFLTGTALYDMYGTNKAMKALFAKGETPHARKLLEDELKDINEKGKRPAPSPDIVTILPMPEGTDTVLQAIQLQWKEKYALMNHKRAELDRYGDDNRLETRGKCAVLSRDILLLEKEVNALWATRDYYQENGHLPETKTKSFHVPQDPVEYVKRLVALKRYINRYKQSLAADPGNTSHADKLMQYQAEWDYLNQNKPS